MPLELTAEQARVLGCLMEKAVTTPDQYPLTLNALVNACNQKSSRNPVMNLDSGTVERTCRELADAHLLKMDENFRSRVQKFSQRLCGTPFAKFQFDPPQYAVVCLLLLRGPQTPGELRTRSGRLHEFADNDEVRATLETLISPEEGSAVVVRQPRKPGRQDHEYMHVFHGEEESVAPEPVADPAPRAAAAPAAGPDRLTQLEERVARLEAELAALREDLGA